MKMQGKLNTEQKRLVEENLGLVHGVLKRMGLKKDYEDFFGIGCIGLCKAALCWETGRLPFSTYATHFVKHELINQLKYTHSGKRSSAAAQPFEDTDERLSAFDTGFERAQTRLMLREPLKNLDELLGRGDASVIRLLAQGRSPQQAAQALHLSLTAVYNARARASQRLKDWMNE
jgi:RNA polymerase sigma factor (sigma-70 family)